MIASLRRFWLRLYRLVRPGPAEQDFDREIASHLGLLEEEFLRRGLPMAAAHTAARRALGGVAQTQELHREARAFAWLGDAIRDVPYACRTLWRTRGFSATVVMTLALGTGANTGIFSIVNGYLRPLPVPAADRIVVLAAVHPRDEIGFRYRFSYPALVDYREQADVFSDVFGWETRLGGMTVDGHTARFLHSSVTGNFFTGLEITPAIGRLFRPGEGEHAGAETTVVLGYAYWMSRFGGDPGVIDTVVRINGDAARIVGVAPEGFHGLYAGTEMDGYVPLSARKSDEKTADEMLTDRASASLAMLGRLKPGVSLEAAQTAADVVAARLAADHPVTEKGVSVRLIPEPYARPIPVPFVASVLPFARTLSFFLGGMVLLIACFNVMNLAFVRATVRQRELAIRSALGSSRGRLMRMLLVESLIVSGAGTMLGMFVGQLLTTLLVRSLHLSIDIPIVLDARFDWRVFSFALATAVLAALVVGVLPAIRASRTQVTSILHEGARSASPDGGRLRTRRTLVVAQIAGSLVLLVVAGFFVRSVQRSARIDVGFDATHLFTIAMDPRQLGYDVPTSEAFYGALERRVRAMPGVEHAALSWVVPMSYVFWSCPVEAEGDTTQVTERPSVGFNTIGTDYFETLRLPIVRGRAFDARDTVTSLPVVVVNRTLAQLLWPGREAVGRRLRAACSNEQTLWTVIGVAADSKYVAPFERPLPYLYLALGQLQPEFRMLQVRSALPTAEVAAAVDREVQALGPGIPTFDGRTMEQVIAGGPGFTILRVGAIQATAMGALGLVLAIVGLYGVVSYGAAQRTREIGIRLALGAEPRDVRRLVLMEGTAMVAGGVAIGLLMSVGVTFLLTRFVGMVSPTDPVTFSAVTIALVVITFGACELPARRAMRVPPMVALRHE